jgi:hypothetical protein
MNRSPSGHAELCARGQRRVSSYGTSDAVRLPGRVGMHVFAFGVRYADMLARMLAGERANATWMAAYGIAAMLQVRAAAAAKLQGEARRRRARPTAPPSPPVARLPPAAQRRAQARARGVAGRAAAHTARA